MGPGLLSEGDPMKGFLAFALIALFLPTSLLGCIDESEPTSTTGVKKATATVQTDPDGYTVEQKNIMGRLAEDNKPGAVKHLYVISAYSGQVILYSTVKGKVTSGGKRLTPTSVEEVSGTARFYNGVPVQIGNYSGWTREVIQDDGTYGSSGDYVYWWDVRGVFHQHYVTGGAFLHVANQPISAKSVILNLETTERRSD
jgi:hypothetical protein